MHSRARTFVAPAFLFACLILGGSSQGIWQNMVLQLAGIGLLAWSALDRSDSELSSSTRQLLLLAAVGLGFAALQLIPLPVGLWSSMGPRGKIVGDFARIGMPLPAEPLSLDPAGTLSALLSLIPALALFCAIARLKAYRPVWLAVAILAGTVLSIALGALQVASASGEGSPWYLFADASFGRAVGFFANGDHFATLLLVAIPFLVAIPAAGRTASFQRYSAFVTVAAGLGIVILVGLALNGSLAGYGLTVPVLALSTLILLPARSKWRTPVLVGAFLLVIAGLAALESASIGAGGLGQHAQSAVESRGQIIATTINAIGDFLPFGSGVGTFQSVFPLYERAEQITSVFVIHAHNDYAELVLELGIPGALLIVTFLAWWAVAVWRVWRTAEASTFARAAAIASGAILVHSIVDFPLRTAAIAACFSTCLALLADGRVAPLVERKQLRKRRHVEFR